jgi:hypothetical protein
LKQNIEAKVTIEKWAAGECWAAGDIEELKKETRSGRRTKLTDFRQW